jgi:hypothetical protein
MENADANFCDFRGSGCYRVRRAKHSQSRNRTHYRRSEYAGRAFN